jgi:hypothetical protein
MPTHRASPRLLTVTIGEPIIGERADRMRTARAVVPSVRRGNRVHDRVPLCDNQDPRIIPMRAAACRARLVVAAASASLGALALGMSLHNDPPLRPVARALAVLSLPLILCAPVLVGPVRETENQTLQSDEHTAKSIIGAAGERPK